MAVLVTHGSAIAIEQAETCMRLYGEDFEDYIKEFRNA